MLHIKKLKVAFDKLVMIKINIKLLFRADSNSKISSPIRKTLRCPRNISFCIILHRNYRKCFFLFTLDARYLQREISFIRKRAVEQVLIRPL
jgi:hypothetical protein